MNNKFAALALLFLFLCLPVSQSLADRIGVFATRYDPADFEAANGYGAMVRAPLVNLIDFDLSVSRIDFDDFNLTPIEVGLLLNIPIPAIDPYVGVGAGYYRFSGSNPDSLSSDWSYFPVAGLSFSIGPLGLYGEARYRMLETDGDSGDADLTGFGINLGLSFSY